MSIRKWGVGKKYKIASKTAHDNFIRGEASSSNQVIMSLLDEYDGIFAVEEINSNGHVVKISPDLEGFSPVFYDTDVRFFKEIRTFKNVADKAVPVKPLVDEQEQADALAFYRLTKALISAGELRVINNTGNCFSPKTIQVLEVEWKQKAKNAVTDRKSNVRRTESIVKSNTLILEKATQDLNILLSVVGE